MTWASDPLNSTSGVGHTRHVQRLVTNEVVSRVPQIPIAGTCRKYLAKISVTVKIQASVHNAEISFAGKYFPCADNNRHIGQ